MDIGATKMYDTCESELEDSPTFTVRYARASVPCSGVERATRLTGMPSSAMLQSATCYSTAVLCR
jgi:hypothetical protein